MDRSEALGSAPERRIGLSGPVNFRDLGGYDTLDGRRVRWRRLFRSDSLSPVTADDAQLLTEELGLLAVVDLRTGRELEREGRGGLADVALHYHHVPLIDEDSIDPDGPGHRLLPDLYTRLLAQSAGRVSAALAAIASEVADHPTVFHCTAGKDRTGVVAALVLGLLGVSEDDIVADYVLTQDVMPVMIERFPRRALRSSGEARYPSPVLRAEADTMRQTLAVLVDDYGSAAGWAEAAALDPAVVTALRTALLTDPDE